MSVVRVLGVVVPLAALGFLLLQQANVVLDRSLQVAFGDGERSHGSAWFDVDGAVVAKGVVVHPDPRAPDVAVRFERARVETPGWAWFARNAFDRNLAHATFDRLHLILAGVTSDAGLDPASGDLGPFGAVSASPFEALGCLNDARWLRPDLEAMGLMPGTTTLEFDYRVDGKELLTSIVLDTPQVSTARLERREQLPAAGNALRLDRSSSLTRSERWVVQDQGFVKARNAACAKKDGVAYQAFVARHVDSVVRVLEAGGLAADPGAIEAYRSFAHEGGELAFGGDYPQPLRSDQVHALRETGVALLRMHGIVERRGQRMEVQWRRFDPRPLAGLDAMTPYAALRKERGEDPSAHAAPVAGAAAAATSLPASIASRTGGRPLASSLPAASTVSLPGSRLPWDELSRYRGRLLQVWTAHNPPRTVTLMDANAGELSVKAHLPGGSANYRITKGAFLRATLIQ